jgi:hypothetical protein
MDNPYQGDYAWLRALSSSRCSAKAQHSGSLLIHEPPSSSRREPLALGEVAFEQAGALAGSLNRGNAVGILFGADVAQSVL